MANSHVHAQAIGIRTFVGEDPALARPSINVVTALFAFMAAIGLATGIYAFFKGHHVLYNPTREMPWGILISTYVFFVVTSTGLYILSVLGHGFGGQALEPLSNRGLFLAIATILAGFTSIGFELENPWRMAIYNVLSPNLTSNIWWMGTLYGLCVTLMILEFYCLLIGRFGTALALGVLGVLGEVGANTNLGAVFALLSSRPFWFGAQLPIYFLASAILSGAAAIIFFTYIGYALRGRELEQDMRRAMGAAAKVVTLFLFIIILATVWRFLSIFTGGSDMGRQAALALLKGPLAVNFWVFEVAIGLILPLLLLLGSRMENPTAMFLACAMVLIGAFVQRYDLVVGGQIVPVFSGLEITSPKYLAYSPSVAELLIVMGCVGICGTLFLLGERFFIRLFDFRH
ncbi:polysulfide reductase NrfD [Thermosulfuriphilus ammonigenes]|uniref:Polysulfide reductase NrfD n=1 Tax=Thermosulfuriphilus ammonigenes TaxID=1936021 RepID=A0A6G7PX30_9BACT|nr:NrfD/PsrC family molybdoenzyme membrane anchor subunit [Thermosulfuriphilus ammonigenes]MBA2849693.1 molybdopterin-containing oxidoreductase family membrane subunit [Thermosulfuriphilus ammonigenes]QIJ72212.1 polysulfide reductase NrfD [Thermosulfuriphilus ammonigenes]